jgi:hypothetical protein
VLGLGLNVGGGATVEVLGRPHDAPGMIRTCDLCLRRAALYPLSYGRRGTQCSGVRQGTQAAPANDGAWPKRRSSLR